MSRGYLHLLDRVEIGEDPAGPFGPASILVVPHWKGVDRTVGTGWGLPIGKAAIAARLKAAIESGRFYSSVEVRTDVAGMTYVSADHPVTGRGMAAQLQRMGF